MYFFIQFPPIKKCPNKEPPDLPICTQPGYHKTLFWQQQQLAPWYIVNDYASSYVTRRVKMDMLGVWL